MKERFKRIATRAMLLTTLAVMPTQMWAVPALPVRSTVTLADGTKVEATLQGDEHLHFFRLDDGRLALPQNDGNYRLASEQEVSTLWTERMTEARKRQSTRLMKARGEELWTPVWQKSGRAAAKKYAAKASTAFQGQKRGLVILVNFTDLYMSVPNPQATFNDFFNKEGYNQGGMTGSVHDYFASQSYGQLDLLFDVVGPVTMSQPHSYYGEDKDGSTNANIKEMVEEACRKADSQVDYTRYDWDGDGEVDQVFFIFAGYAQSQGAPSDCIWPHEWSVSERNLSFDGVRIGTYACSSELRGKEGTEMDGIGTACHEFSHCLGIMDHYDTQGSNYGMGSWDVMASGSYNNSSRTPSGYTAYERWVSGWLEPVEINKATYVQNMKALVDEPEAYVLYNDYNPNEFYLLENRQQKSWDSGHNGHGLLVVHVDYDRNTWLYNQINVDANRQRMTIIPADASLNSGSTSGDPWPGSMHKTSLTDATSPAAIVYNAGPDGYAFMGKPLTEIAEDEARGQISFACMRGTLPTPVLGEVSDVTSSSFSIDWQPVEGATSYEISLHEKPAPYATPEQACVLKEDFSKCVTKSIGLSSIGNKLDKYLSTMGWTGTNLFTSPNYLKMGKGDKMGTLLTPSLDTPLADDITIVLTMAPYAGNDKVSGSLKIQVKGKSLSGSFSAKDKKTFFFTASGIAEPFTLSIEPSTVGYISYLAVYDGSFTQEQLGFEKEEDDDQKSILAEDGKHAVKRKVGTTTTFTTTEPHYTFTGLTSTSKYTVTVRALTDLGPSKWSLEKEVKLDQTSIAAPVATDKTANTNTGVYNLQGQPVAHPQHGIYISNGKKVLLK